MSIFAAVIKSLIGQVFVTSVDGVRRQVFEGDRIFAGEQVTTADGGSVTLEMANGETVQLGANSTWQAGNPETQDVADAAQAPPSELEQALAAGMDPTVDLEPTAAGPGAGGGGGSAGGGHSAVMLSETAQRVDPTIGFQTTGLGTPGFNLIEDNDPAIFTTAATTPTPGTTPTDTTAPAVTIGIDPIAGDDVLNSAELGAATTVITGTVGGDAQVGDAITLNLGGNLYSGTVIALGNGTLGFSIAVSSADLGSFNSISATVSSADAAGNVGTATASRPYTVDTTAPVITVDAPAISNDTTPTITGSTDAPVGSTVTLTVTQGSTVITVTTPVLAGGTYTVDIPQALAEGPYTIGAQVTDRAGNTGSATDSGAIDTTAPAITVDAPPITNDTTPTISGTTDAPVGSTVTLTITQGTTVLTTTATVVTGGTYSANVPAGLAEGPYSVGASVTDPAGNTGSATDSGAIDTTAPVITVDAPAITNDPTPTITGTTDAPVGSTVTLTVTQGTNTFTVSTPVLSGGTYTIELNQPLAEGPYSVDAKVTDAAGNTGSATDSGAIDTTAPAITVDAPAITNDTTPTITGTTDAPVGSTVTLTVTQGSTVITITTPVLAGGTYTVDLPQALAEGPYTVGAQVTDPAGNTGSATDSGSIDTTAPAITVDAPAITNDTTPTITGTTDAPIGSTVTLTITQGTTVLTTAATVVAGGTYSTDVPAGLVEGSYSVDATVTDAAGNTGSANDNGAIDTTAPAITVDAPAITNDTTPTITGTTDAPVGSTVTLTVTQGTTVLTTTATVVAGGTYSADVPAGLAEGSYSVDATVTDTAGNTGSATDSGAIDTTAPVITVDAPAITNDTTPTITGTTDAPVGSTVTLTINQGTTVLTTTATVVAGGTYSADVPAGLAEGSYSVDATVTDAAGNTGSATDSGAIDTTAPAITVDAPAITNDTTPTISGTTDAPVGSTVTLTITQGSTVITVTTPVLAGGTYAVDVPQGLAEGSYSVDATVTDAAGNTGSATDSGAIDTTAPVITVDAPAVTNDTTPTITGSTDAPVGSTVTLTITQGSTVITVTTPVLAGGTYTVDVPQALAEGPYTIGAQVTDPAGNTGSATDSGAIDTTAPAITVDAPAVTNDTTPTISGTTDAPVGSTVTLTVTQGSTVITMTTPVLAGGTYTVDVPQGLTEGSYSVDATVTDAAGNTGSATDSGAIDTTAPAITVDAPAITNDTTPTISGTTDAPVGSTVTLMITQGSTAITATTPVLAGGTYTVDVPQGLAEGSYSVDATVTDAAGNTGSATDSGAIDTTAPAITVDAPAITNDTTPTITGTTDAPVGSTVTLTITQGTTVLTATATVVAGGTYSTDVPAGLVEGSYSVNATVTDAAGNTGSATDSGAIDTTAPMITVDAPAITNDTTPTITGTTDAPVGSTVTLTITQGTTVLTTTATVVAGGTYSANVPAGLAEGPYSVGASVTDPAGNTGSATDSGAIDTTAPVITVDAPAITNDPTPTITGTTDAPVGSTVTLTVTQGSTVITVTTPVLAGGSYTVDVPQGLTEGSYSVDATVTDAAGNTASATDSGAIDTTAPAITVDAPTVTNDTTPTITGTTDAPVGSTVTLTVTQGTNTFTVSTPVLSGGTYTVELPQQLTEGSYSVNATVTDAAGNTGSATDSGAIDTTAPAITVDAPAITNDTTPTITGTTDAPVGSTVTLTVTQGTNTFTVSTPVLSGGTYTVELPQQLTEGPYSVDAKVTDAAGNTGSANDNGAIDTTAPAITVDAPAITNDTTPTISGTTDAPVGSTVTLTITQGSTVITVTTPVLAGGTYTIELNQPLAEGPYSVDAKVTDAAGNTGSATDSGAIDTTAPLITVDAPAITNDTTPTITGTTDAPVGSTVTLTVTQGTSTFTVSTPVLSGGTYTVELPQQLAEGPYSVDAKVTDAAGNTGSATDSGAIDTTAPAITVDAPAITNDTTPTITGTTDAPVGSTVTLTITQGTTVLTTTATVVTGGTYSANVPAGLAEGSYSVDATVTDAAGNTGSATDSGAIDTTAPVITVDAPAITNDTTPTITGTTDAPIGSTVTLTITQGTTVLTTTATVVAGGTYSTDVPAGLVEGSYSVDATVTDVAGNTGTATDSGAIDTTAPAITVDAPAITNDTTPTITGTTDAPVGSTVTLTITQGTNVITVTTPVLAGGTYTVDIPQGLTEGSYSVDATVTDAAGNTGSATDSGAIDTTAPAITVDAPAITNDTTPTITGSTDAPVGSTVTLTITQGSTVITVTTPVLAGGTYTVDLPQALAEGPYTVAAQVTDPAGNTGSATDSGAINTTAPAITVDAPATTNDTTPTITGTTDAPVGSTVALTITQGTTVFNVTTPVLAGGTYSVDVPQALGEGPYSVDAEVTDAAGNTGSATDSGTIDTTAPSITVDAPAISNDTTPTITGTTDAPVGSTVTLTVTQGSTVITVTTPVLAGGTYTVDVPQALAEGPYTVIAQVSDPAGNIGSATDSGAIDVTAPVPTITLDANITADDVINSTEAGQQIPVTGTVGGDAKVGDTVTLTVNGNTYTGLVTNTNGTLGFSINVPGSDLVADAGQTITASISTTDAAGNVGTASDTEGYSVDTTAPVPTITLDANITADDVINSTEAGQQIPVTGTVGGDAKVGDTVTLTVNGNTYTGLVTNTNGTLGFSINVPGSDLVADAGQTITASISTTDAAGNVGTASDTEGYSVDTTAPVPTITLDANITADDVINSTEAGQQIPVTGTVGGDAKVGDTVTLTVNGNTYTGLVTNTNGTLGFSINVPGSDLVADAGQTITASISTTDAAGNVGTASDTEGYSVDITAPAITVDAPAVSNDTTPTITGTTDAPVGSTVTLTITQGSTVTTVTTPVLAGGTYTVAVPQALAEGPYSVEAQVTDPAGNTGSATDNGAIDTLAGDTGAAPIVTITEDANNDGIISKAELNGPVDVRVGLPAGAVAGDTLVITNGTTPQTITLTAAQIATGYVDTTFASPGEGNSITVEATLRDQFGNTSEKGTDTAKVDTLAGTTGAAPIVTVTEDANNDGIISKAELNGPVDVRVGLPAGAVAGDTLVITNGTTPQTVTLTAAQITAGFVTTTFPSPGEGNTLTVEATLRDQFGNTSEKGTDTAKVDTLAGTTGAAPVVTITEDANNDGIISKAELNGPVDVRVGLPAGAVAGDTLVITNGTTPQTITLTAAQITAGFVTTTFPSPGEGNTLTVDAVLKDQFGNTSEKGTDTAKVDTLAGTTGAAPVVTITEDANNDGIISKAELNGPVDVRVGLPAGAVAGDTLVITNGTTPQTITLTAAQIATGYVDTTFPSPGEGNTLTVEATLRDQFGNTSEKGTDTAKVDTLAGTTGAAPIVTITEDANNDGVISKAELNGEIDVRVGLPAGAVAGDTLVITNGTTPQTVTLTAAQIAAGFVTTTFANPGEGTSITVEATLRDQFGNTSEKGTDTARVDTLAGTTGAAPVVTITEDANNDGIISKAELNGEIDVRVGLPAGAVAGDTLVITNGTTPQTVTLTAAQIAAGFVTTTFANPGEGTSITVEATLRDQFGNTSEKGTDTARVDTLAGTTGAAPVVTITEDANNDGIISKAELNGEIDVRVGLPAGAVAGDTLVITNGTTPQTVTLTAAQITAGFVTTTFANPGEGNSITVEATLRDQFGNTSEKGTDTAKVDTLAGTTGAAPVVTITEDANNDGIISKAELNGPIDVRVGLPAGAVAGDTLVITNGTTPQTVTLTAAQITAGFVTTTFANPGEGTSITVEATLRDQFGNTSEKGTDTARVDTLAGTTGAAPVVTITEDANNDGIISKAELNGPVDVRVGLPAGAVAGDTLVITNGTTPQTITLTAAQINAGFVTTTFANPGEGNTLTVEATLRDQFGNTSNKGTDSARVDTLAGATGAAPTVEIREDINNDGVIGQNELSGAIDVRVGLPAGSVAGDTLSVTDGTTIKTFTLTAAQITTGYLDTTFANPGEGKTIVVDATLQDQFGNTSSKGSDQALVNSNPVAVDDPVGSPYTVQIGDLGGAVTSNNWALQDSNNQKIVIQARDGNGNDAKLLELNVDGNQNALGVDGSPRAVVNPVPDQLEFDPTTGKSESITLNFSGNLNQASFSVSRLVAGEEGGEVGRWVAMYEGVEVASGTFKLGTGGAGTFSLNTGTQVFDSIRFEALPTVNGTGDGSDYFLTGFSGSGPASANSAYVVNESQTLIIDQGKGLLNNDSDAQANQTLNVVKINGADVPANGKVVLATGVLTVNADGSFNFAANDNNLKSGEIKTQSFTYTVSDGYGGTATANATITIIGTEVAPGIGAVSAAVDSTGGQVDEGDNAVFTVSLTNASSTPTTFSLALSPGTAVAGSDYNAALTNQSFSNGVTYNATTGQVTVPAGVTSFTVTVPTINDTVSEPTETFSLTVGAKTGTATIIDNDAAPTVSTVSSAVDSTGGQVDEGDNAVFTVNLTNASSTPTTFSLALNPGTAVAGSDYNAALTNQNFSNGVTYNATTGQVTVPAGVTSFTVTVPTINDTVSEPTETFSLTVGGKTGTATIIDNDAAPTVSTVSSAVDSTGGQVDEGDNAVFTVNLTNASSTPTTFSLALSPGTAVAGSDYNAALTNQSFSNGVTYNATTGQVTVPAGVTSFTVIVPTINDTVSEPTENFTLSVGGKTGTATIIDNDAAPTVSTVSSAVDSTGGQVDEGDNAVFTVNLTNASSTPTTFSLALNAGTATAGSDYNGTLTNQSFSNGVTYNATTGQVTVPAGVTSFTVTVPTINDTVSEPTETFSLTVGGKTGTATIIDNDAAPTVSTVSSAVDSAGGQVDEGDNAVFTVNLTNASSTPTTFSLALNAGTATAGSDYNAALTNQSFSNGVTYNATTGQVTVPAGVTSFTVTVPTINDTVNEPTETFSLTVGGKTGTATIIDNDPVPTVKTIDVGQAGTADDNVVEGNNLVFNVTLSNASSTPTVLAFNATGTATANVDYKLTAQSFSNGVTYDANTGKITVPAGVTSFSVTVQTLADNVVAEPLETVRLDIGGQSAIGGIIDGTPDAKDDSYTKVTGLKAEYYGYNDASTGAGNDGANLTNLSQVRQFIDSHNPAATFNATKLDYGTLSNASGLGNGTNLQNFLGVDVASGNGAKANSLSTDPGNSSDAIIKMAGYINLAAGTYQFKVTADDGYSIRINGQVVAEFNNIQSTSTATGKTFTISAAQAGAQQIEIIYWDQGGDARLKVELGQGGTFKVVDSDMLYHIPGTSSLVVESGESLTVAGSTLLGNDTDPNGDALSITSVQNATNGTVTLNNGNVIFTPKAGFYGDASFQYSVSDGKGGSDTATVTLKVNQAANVIHVAGDGSNDNGDNTIRGGAGNDVLLGDAGGTLTTVQPATNYNIALLVDTSGSMQGDRMSLTKSALSNFAKTLAGHDGVVNLTLVGFAGDVTLSARVADLQNGTKLDSLLADIQRLTANGGTNYEAAFKEASAWFDAQSAAGNTKAAGYENLTFFLSDGDPTFYYNGNTTTVSGNGSTTNDQVLLGSLDTFNVLAGKSAVQAIGIGSGVSEKNLSLFDNTTDSPAFSYLANGSGATLANFNNDTTGWNNLGNWDITGTGFFSGSAGRNSDALMIRDTAGGSPVTATTPTLTIAEGTLSTLRFAYGTADTGNGDSLSWKLQQLVQGVWTDVQSGGGTTAGNWTTAETSVVGAGTYRLAFTVDDKSNNLANATMWIDNISRVDYTKVPVGKVEIVNSADELSVALHGGSNAHVPVTVGNDIIHGGDGNDIIFGDVINTDGLKWGVDGNPTKPTDLHDGAGVKALETFLELKNGIAPTNGDLYDYIRANHETFNVAGDTRGGADQLYGGGGNDILYGQGGNDLLVGGAGDDILFGGAGADTFAWQKGDFGKDVIKDFNVAEGDTIDLSSLLQDHSNNLDSYLKLVTDNGSSTLLISTKGEFNTADTSSQQVAAKADVQIDLGQASLPSYDINSLIANHTIKVDP